MIRSIERNATMAPRMKRVIDCSMSLYNAQPRYVGNPPLKFTPHSTFWRAGDPFGGETEDLEMNTHCGTHLDVPYHVIAGARKIGDMPAEEFMGEAIVIDASNRKEKLYIQISDLKEKYDGRIKEGDIVIVYTGWGPKRDYTTEWLKDYPSLTTDCAKWIVSKKPKGFAIDVIGLESFYGPKTSDGGTLRPAPDGESVHKIILGDDIWGVEELYLPKEALDRERWWFSALPLKFDEAGGAPTRAVLVEFE